MMEIFQLKQSYKAEHVRQNAQTSDSPQTLIKISSFAKGMHKNNMQVSSIQS